MTSLTIDTTGLDTTATKTGRNSAKASPAAGMPSGWKSRQGGDLMDASQQWMTRPADEAFHTADEFLAKARAVRAASKGASVPWRGLKVAPVAGNGLVLTGPSGREARLTNYSMGQLASAAGAPASYMRKLPAELAAECLSHGLKTAETPDADARLLLTTVGSGLDLRAITTTKYARVWDHTLAQKVHDLCERGTWGAAEAFRSANAASVAHAWGTPTALPMGWVGDRSSFTLLVDYDSPVEVAGVKYARFFMLSNSEVGAASLKATIGLLDFVCCNMIIWGSREVYEASFRHVGDVASKWRTLMAPTRTRLGAGGVEYITSGIRAARELILADEPAKAQAVARAATGLPKATVEAAYQRAVNTPRYGDPRSVWGMVNGLTEESQTSSHTDKRVAIDAAAARLMGLL